MSNQNQSSLFLSDADQTIMQNLIFLNGVRLVTLLFVLILAACSSTERITLQQLDSPITVNGSLSNWNTSETMLNSSDDIRYHAAIHGDFLYIFADVRDARVNQAVRQLGLIVYLSNSEDNRNRVGIGYPAGSLNLLREYPNAYNDFLTDAEWGRKPENVQLISDLNDEIFSRVMIVERYDGSNAEYGFVDKSQLEIDGIEISTDEDRRLVSLEMKIPLDGSTIFEVEKQDLWIGFAVEPPTMRIRGDEDRHLSRQERSGYGYRGTGRTQQSRQRQMFQKNDWFLLTIN